MATVPNPATWTVGDLLTASNLNLDLRDSLNFLLAPPLAILIDPGTGPIPDATVTALPWPSEAIDRDGGHSNSTNNTRYTCQTAGYYDIYCAVAWQHTTANRRNLNIRKNGSTDLAGSIFDQTAATDTSFPLYPTQSVSLKTFLSVGDYVETTVWHNNGGAIPLSAIVTGLQRWELQWVST